MGVRTSAMGIPAERVVDQYIGSAYGEPALYVEYQSVVLAYPRSDLVAGVAFGVPWAKRYLAMLDSKTA